MCRVNGQRALVHQVGEIGAQLFAQQTRDFGGRIGLEGAQTSCHELVEATLRQRLLAEQLERGTAAAETQRRAGLLEEGLCATERIRHRERGARRGSGTRQMGMMSTTSSGADVARGRGRGRGSRAATATLSRTEWLQRVLEAIVAHPATGGGATHQLEPRAASTGAQQPVAETECRMHGGPLLGATACPRVGAQLFELGSDARAHVGERDTGGVQLPSALLLLAGPVLGGQGTNHTP
mmetsp:Transcript_52401/g.131715  ORF Transcript_52401/g.131715 Transcript_52401/m.131715 type:complete len:238 (-) Transcript_52401:493-1206(-)